MAGDRYSKARAAQEEARQEVRRRKARRLIERVFQGEEAELLVQVLGLDGERYAPRVCPHCREPFNGGRDRCQKVACVAAARRTREELDAKIMRVSAGHVNVDK